MQQRLPSDPTDYVYVFGIEWAEDLLAFLERDPDALRAMQANDLSFDDVRRYYLIAPHFERVYAGLIEDVEAAADPVAQLMRLIAREKALTQRAQRAAGSAAR